MTNNDILRRVRYIFDFHDDKMIGLFGLSDCKVTRAEVSDWMKQEDESDYKKFIRNCEMLVRRSIEYKLWRHYIVEVLQINQCMITQ